MLAIAVVFDPRFKYTLLDLSYAKIYGPDSLQLKNVKETLSALFNEYVQGSTITTNFSSCSQGSNEVHSSTTQHVEKDKDNIQSNFFEVWYYFNVTNKCNMLLFSNSNVDCSFNFF